MIGPETVDGLSFDIIKEILKHNHQNHVSHYNDDDLNHDNKNAESDVTQEVFCLVLCIAVPRISIFFCVVHCCTPYLC